MRRSNRGCRVFSEVISGEIYVASLTVPNRAVTEAVTNAVKHGHGDQPNAIVTCEIEVTASHLTLRIIDGGRGFTLPSPTRPPISTEPLERLPESGYGVPIIQSVFPTVRAIRVSGRFGIELSLPRC